MFSHYHEPRQANPTVAFGLLITCPQIVPFGLGAWKAGSVLNLPGHRKFLILSVLWEAEVGIGRFMSVNCSQNIRYFTNKHKGFVTTGHVLRT